MTWVKKDDQHHLEATTEALLALGDIAGWANTLDDWAESYAGANLTDGIIPRHVPARLVGRDPTEMIAALVKVHRWAPHPDGWILTTYLARNPTRAQVEKLRADRKRAGHEGGRTNSAQADRDGRRHADGTYAPKHLLGDVSGRVNGPRPSNPPDTEPTPSPVSRLPSDPEPERTSPPPPSPTVERGRRRNGTSQRQQGSNPRARGTEPRASGASPRQRRQAEKRSKPTLVAVVAAEMLKGLES